MKSNLYKSFALVAALGVCAPAAADTTITEVFTCSVNEGKTLDDVKAANSRWVRFMKANVDEGIGSAVVTTVVGNAESGFFLYVDTFPNLAVWGVAKTATEDNDEGEAIDEALGDAASCSENRLYSAEDS